MRLEIVFNLYFVIWNLKKLMISEYPTIHGVLLAAGFSRRMGKFKPLLLYQGKPFVVQALTKMLSVCRQVVVVTGHRSEEVVATLDAYFRSQETEDDQATVEFTSYLSRVRFAHNPDFALGMFASLQTGLRRLPEGDWVLYHFVDQPHLPEDFYRQLVAQIDADYQWIQPAFGGRRGHPLLLHQNLIRRILELTPYDSLQTIDRNRTVRKKIWECPFPQVRQDFDEPDDLISWS